MNKQNDKINKIIIDTLVKSSKLDYLINTLMDMNNGQVETDFDITPEEFNKIDSLLVETIKELSNVVMKVSTQFRKDFNKYVQEQEKLQSNKDSKTK